TRPGSVSWPSTTVTWARAAGSRARCSGSGRSSPAGRARTAAARALPGADPARLAIWSFSASAGHVFRIAAGDPGVAAAIAQTPYADGLAASRTAPRHKKPAAMLRFAGLGIADAVGALADRPPRLVPLTGQPGAVAMLTTPDSRDGGRALDPDGRYPEWRQEVAARSAVRL